MFFLVGCFTQVRLYSRGIYYQFENIHIIYISSGFVNLSDSIISHRSSERTNSTILHGTVTWKFEYVSRKVLRKCLKIVQ